jgi:hypothetical protein
MSLPPDSSDDADSEDKTGWPEILVEMILLPLLVIGDNLSKLLHRRDPPTRVV